MMRYLVTSTLIAINLVAYAICVIASGHIADIPLEVLERLGAIFGPVVVFKAEWWRLPSAMFLHGSLMHLSMNMISLYIVGRGIEHYFSKSAYVAIYFLSGLAGAMASLYMHPTSVAVGASGAIFGIFGALIGFFIVHYRKVVYAAKGIFQDIAVILGLNLALGLAMPSIDMSAHIAGLVTGVVGGILVGYKKSLLALFILISFGALYGGAMVVKAHYATLFV